MSGIACAIRSLGASLFQLSLLGVDKRIPVGQRRQLLYSDWLLAIVVGFTGLLKAEVLLMLFIVI
jgi:hypothetical protein